MIPPLPSPLPNFHSYFVRTHMLSHFSCVQLFATLWTIAHQAPLSMGFSRQEYRSGFPFPSPGYLPDPGIETASLVSPTLAGEFLPLCHLGSLTLQYCSLNRRHLLINHSTFLDVEKQVSSSNIIKKHSYLNFSCLGL